MSKPLSFLSHLRHPVDQNHSEPNARWPSRKNPAWNTMGIHQERSTPTLPPALTTVGSGFAANFARRLTWIRHGVA